MHFFFRMNLLLAGVALLLTFAPNANAADMDMGGRGLRGVDTATTDAAAADASAVTYRRYLQAEADPKPKPKPVDEEVDTAMEMNNNTFVAEVENGERALGCMGDGTFCDNVEGLGFESCENCCSKPATFWPDRMFWACGSMPCWGTNTRCLEGTTCNSCCNGSHWVWHWFGHHCK